MRDRGRTVFSTGPGGAAAAPGARDTTSNEPAASMPAERHRLRVRIEKTGRKGKAVTVAGPFKLRRVDAEALLRSLKQSCGCGGTLRPVQAGGAPAFELELQGERGPTLSEALAAGGFVVR